MVTRRRWLGGIAAAMAALALPRAGRAGGGGARRFLFVFLQGGWDPLCVFAPMFGVPGIEMEPEAAPRTFGSMRLVDHPDRPSVRAYFEAWGARTTVLNGVSVRSISHETCTMLAMTGTSSGAAADWPTLLAAGGSAGFSLPHLVVAGPSFAGDLGVVVSRFGAAEQLAGLVDGTYLDGIDIPTGRPDPASERVLDAYLQKRTAAFAAVHALGPSGRLAADLDESVRRAVSLKRMNGDLDLGAGGGDLVTQSRAAIKALAGGLSRTAIIADTGIPWDTHSDNSQQTALFERLFSSLDAILRDLSSTPGPSGDPLLSDTTVVLLSEMGRTPRYNGNKGRDHWPFTSVVLAGAGVIGNRVIGSFSDGYTGLGVDRATGDLSPLAPTLTTADIGATLLAIGGVDPGGVLTGAAPIRGAMA